jgi:DNA-binding response OmpR family regulator
VKTAEEKRAYAKAYREANKEKVDAGIKAWREANAEHVRARGAAVDITAISINLVTNVVRAPGGIVRVSHRSAALLFALIDKDFVSRREIERIVWGSWPPANSRQLDALISCTRARIRAVGLAIQTRYKGGYKLVEMSTGLSTDVRGAFADADMRADVPL